MNSVDLIIIGLVAVLALMGMRSGLLRPISGIGGLAIGVLLALQHSADVASALVDQIDGDLPRKAVAFAGIVVLSVAAARLGAWGGKRLLETVSLGWIDHAAGATAGAVLGLALAGTGTYLAIGANLEPTRDLLAESQLAPVVTQATLLSSSKPWCSQVEDGAQSGPDCTGLMGLFGEYFGDQLDGQVNNLLGGDDGTLADVVRTSLTGSPADLANILNSDATAPLFSGESDAVGAVIGGTLSGKSPEEIAAMLQASEEFTDPPNAP